MSPEQPSSLGRLRLLASAIAGHALDVEPAESGAAAWTNGTIVFIDPGASRNEQLWSLAVQASLVGAGSLQSEILRALARRSTLTCRYLAVEGHRVLASHERLLPASVQPLVDIEKARRSGSPEESLALATSAVEIDDPPRAFGAIHPRRVHILADHPSLCETATSQHFPRSSRQQELRKFDDDDSEDNREAMDIVSSPVGGGGGIGKLLKRIFIDSRMTGHGQPGADSATHWSRRGARRRGSVVTSAASASIPSFADDTERGRFTYPEWDVRRHRYRPNWCTVKEIDVTSSETAPFLPPESHPLRRPLSRIGMGLERRGRQSQGVDLDIDAVVDARVAHIAGIAPDEGVYVDLVRRRRDLAVLFLLDISGSAAEPSAMGSSVHEHQRSAAAVLTTAFHDLGDRVALYAFRSQGRSTVQVVPLKRFGDALNSRVVGKMGGCVPSAYTRLGAAIRHGSMILERDAGTSKRLLVVVSDGLAYDHGYEGTYGESDARRALAEARHRGTGCLCLSVAATTDPGVLRRVFGTAAHATVLRIDQLPSIVGPLFRSALGSAESQRRVFQRKTRAKERLEIERSHS